MSTLAWVISFNHFIMTLLPVPNFTKLYKVQVLSKTLRILFPLNVCTLRGGWGGSTGFSCKLFIATCRSHHLQNPGNMSRDLLPMGPSSSFWTNNVEDDIEDTIWNTPPQISHRPHAHDAATSFALLKSYYWSMSGSSVSVLLHNLWFLGLEKSTLILEDDFRIDLFSNRHHTYSIFCISLDKRFTHHLLVLQSELTSLQKFCCWVTLVRHVCSHTLFVCSVQATPFFYCRSTWDCWPRRRSILKQLRQVSQRWIVCVWLLCWLHRLSHVRKPTARASKVFFQPRMLLQSYLLPLCFENTFPFAWILKLNSGKESVASFWGV